MKPAFSLPFYLVLCPLLLICCQPAAAQMELTGLASFPETPIGQSSAVQTVQLETTASEIITSITVPPSQGGPIAPGAPTPSGTQEYVLGTITGCNIGNGVSNPANSICTVPITFTPAYPGERALPLQVVTSTGNISFGLTGMGLGPLAGLTPGIITTVAGGGTEYPGDNGPATSAVLNSPHDIAVDGAGNIYFSDAVRSVVRKVTPGGILTTVAGSGTGSYSGDNGPAIGADLWIPSGLGVDAAGNLYIADSLNNRIRKVSFDGIITTVAGNGKKGFSGDKGDALNAELSDPTAVAVDISGNLYIADSLNNRVRKVTPGGIITTVAGSAQSGYAGDNGAATNAQLRSPEGVAADAYGNFYISDQNNFVIRKVTSAGIITTLAGSGAEGYSGDNGLATNSELWAPAGLAVDASSNVYIADTWNLRIRQVSPSGNIITVAGNGIQGFSGDNGSATDAELWAPSGVAVDAAGNLYIADWGNLVIRKVDVSQSQLSWPTPTTLNSADSSDNPQTVNISNIGNGTTNLVFAMPSTGNNPNISPAFAYGAASTCPQLNISSSTYSLASGASCTYVVDFSPIAVGPNSGTFVLTDNSLSATSSMQTVSLNGTGALDITTTSLTASPNSLTAGQSLTLTATVTTQSGSTPIGTVTFNNGGTSLGSASVTSGGIATLTITPPAGSYSVVAAYNGSAVEATSTSTAVSVVIAAAPIGDFYISASPGFSAITQLQPATYVITVASSNNFTSPVTLSCSDLPAGTTCSFSPTTVNGGSGSSTLTVQTTGLASSSDTGRTHYSIAALGCLLLFLMPRRIRSTTKVRILSLLIALLVGGTLSGCSTQSGNFLNSNWQITVTGTAISGTNTVTHTTNVTLNMQ